MKQPQPTIQSNNTKLSKSQTSKSSYTINKHGMVVPTAEAVVDALSGITSLDQLEGKDNVLASLFQQTVNAALQAEMNQHLGYSKHERTQVSNSRNGSGSKKIKTSHGEVEVLVPRDRDGDFNPKIIGKHQRTSKGIEDKILYLYGLGNSTGDITEMLDEIYGFEVSRQYVSTITNNILPIVEAWRSRPLDPCYPIVFLDAIRYKIRDEQTHTVESKAVYIVQAVTISGHKEVLGLYVQQNESAKYWMNILSDLQQRGVQDIMICATDNLKGFNEAITAIYPSADHQACIIHQIRNSTRFVSYKDIKIFSRDMKSIYQAKDEKQAKQQFDQFKHTWGAKYPYAITSWETNWDRLMTFMRYPAPVRRIIYTTNSIEGLNRQLRCATKKRASFPHDDAVLKCLYLTIQRIQAKQIMVQNWHQIMNQLTIVYGQRLTQYIDPYMS